MDDSVVLVTGGAGTLGQTVTRAFLERGARVAVPFYKNDSPGALDGVRADFPGRLHAFALDLTTERGAEQTIDQVLEWGGRVDAVAHLVGGWSGGMRIAETPLEIYERMMDLNLRSAWLTARSTLARRTPGAALSFVFVSSQAAFIGRSNHAAYSIAKAALLTLVESIAEEYAGDGVRANAVVLGTLDTDFNRKAMPDTDPASWTTLDEAAKWILHLASPSSVPINGAAIPLFRKS